MLRETQHAPDCLNEVPASTSIASDPFSCAVASLESIEDAIVDDRIVSGMQGNSL